MAWARQVLIGAATGEAAETLFDELLSVAGLAQRRMKDAA